MGVQGPLLVLGVHAWVPCVSRGAASPACPTIVTTAAAAATEAETASQASEPASQASDEEDAPATDIYFVSHPGEGPLAVDPAPSPHTHGLTASAHTEPLWHM